MIARRYGSDEIVKSLLTLEVKPNLDLQNDKQWTALMFACQYSSDEVIECLLSQEKKPDFDKQNNLKV